MRNAAVTYDVVATYKELHSLHSDTDTETNRVKIRILQHIALLQRLIRM